MAPGLHKVLVRSNTTQADSPRIAAWHHRTRNPAIGFDEQQERDLILLFHNNKMLLPALGATARVENVFGDGFCVLYSMMATQGKSLDDNSIQECLDQARNNCYQYLCTTDLDIREWLGDQIMDQLESGWMEAGCQELLAFSEQACFVVISTSTPTEDILALGPLSFRGLLSKLQHVAINVVGENQAHLGQLFMLMRHKHSDPYKKDYAAEHYMSCLPAEGVRNHTFDTSARVWAAYLRQLRSPGPSNVGDATDAASGSAASADLAAKPEAVSALSPAKLIQDVHPGTAQQQQQQQQAESGSMAQEGTTPNQQSLPALLAISATPGAGPATAQQANPQDAELPVLPRPVPAGVTSAVQLPVTPGAAVQKEGGSRLDTSPGTHKPAVQTSLDESLLHEDSHSLPSGTSSGLTSEQGTPKGNKRGFWRKVKGGCRAGGRCVARGLKKAVAWLLHCPTRAVTFIKNVAAALGGSRH